MSNTKPPKSSDLPDAPSTTLAEQLDDKVAPISDSPKQKGAKRPKPEPLSFDDLPDSAFIRLEELRLEKVVPYSRSSMWRKVKSSEFPAPVKLSSQMTAWRVGDVRRWQATPKSFPKLRIKRGGGQ